MEYIDLFKSTAENSSFLKVLFTHKHLQVALSDIRPGTSSGTEVWNADLGVLVLLGQGYVVVGGEEKDIKGGDYFYVPANTEYEIINLGTGPLKMLCHFAAAVFKDGTNEGNKISEIMDPYKVRSSKKIFE